MLEIVHSGNREEYTDCLEQMYLIRHDIYVEKRGWKALEKPDKREVDQFDNDDAVYLLWLDDRKKVYGGMRLIPSDRPHLISEVFPHTVEFEPIPRAPDIYEITRYFALDFEEAGIRMGRISSDVLCGTLEFLVAQRARYMTVVCDTFFLPMTLECGWEVQPLGLPTPYPEGTCISIKVSINAEMLARTRKVRGVSGSVFRNRQRELAVAGGYELSRSPALPASS